MWIMMVYFVLTVAVIYPFADEMMSLFVNSGEQDVIANAAQFMRIANWFTQFWVFWLFCVIVFKDSVIVI